MNIKVDRTKYPLLDATFIYENDILSIKYKKGTIITKEYAVQQIRFIKSISGGKKIKVLFYDIFGITKEARALNEALSHELFSATAIIVTSVLTKTLANFLIYVNLKPSPPAKLFTLEKEAVKWLNSLNIDGEGTVSEPEGKYEAYSHPPSYYDALDKAYFLKDSIEKNDVYKLFYYKNQLTAREEALKLLFRLCWSDMDEKYDINTEANNGRGNVDFKISNGGKDKTIIEFKLASNTHLKELMLQVSVYEEANKTRSSIKIIIYFTENQFIRVNKVLKEIGVSNDKSIVLIDARKDNKISASKMKR